MSGRRTDPQPNGWAMRSSRGRGRGGPKFSKSSKMPTAKRLESGRRQEIASAQQKAYRLNPPRGEKLFEARLVIPGEHLVPTALDEPRSLDDIRTKHEVWITSDDPFAFDISSRSMANLQAALKALNATIHDLRLAEDHTSSRFWVQQPSRVSSDAKIFWKLGYRPKVTDCGGCFGDPYYVPVVDALVLRMEPGISTAAETLMTLGRDLRMRVNFGRINLHEKKRNVGDNLTYAEFEEAIKPYALRIGKKAYLGTKMSDTHKAEAAIRCLVDPSQGLCHKPDDKVQTRCTLTMTVQNGTEFTEVSADVFEGQMSRPSMKKSELRPQLDWYIVAPDRRFDWNLRVNALDDVRDISQDLQALVQSVTIRGLANTGDEGSIVLPRLSPLRPGHLGDKIGGVWLKSSVTLPIVGQPYVVEVNITQEWTGSDVSIPPDVTWGLQSYGVHWDEAINGIGEDGRRKDWGPQLVNIWPGGNKSLKERLGSFLHCILRIQGVLDALDLEDGSRTEEPTGSLI